MKCNYYFFKLFLFQGVCTSLVMVWMCLVVLAGDSLHVCTLCIWRWWQWSMSARLMTMSCVSLSDDGILCQLVWWRCLVSACLMTMSYASSSVDNVLCQLVWWRCLMSASLTMVSHVYSHFFSLLFFLLHNAMFPLAASAYTLTLLSITWQSGWVV